MILSLEGHNIYLFLPKLSGVRKQGTHISDSEINSSYSEEENLKEDAMNDVDKGLVEYFEYVVREENLLYPPNN